MYEKTSDMAEQEYQLQIAKQENELKYLTRENQKLRNSLRKMASFRIKQTMEYEAKIAELQKCRDSVIDRFEAVADRLVSSIDRYDDMDGRESLYCDLNTFESRALVSMIHDTGKVDNDELEMIEKKYHNDGGLRAMLEYFDFLMENRVIEPAGEDMYALTEFGEELYKKYTSDEFTSNSTILYRMLGAIDES